MDYREKLNGEMEQVINYLKEFDLSEKLVNEAIQIKEEISNFKILVPLIGGFNAGKTSLINELIGGDKLPTDIRPETTIAAEIKYGEQSRILAHSKNGEIKEFSVEDIKSIKPSEYLYIEVFENKKILKELKDVVIVDMPGLDSAIEAHNQAILNYIKEGVFYILVSDVEHGIKGSILDFIRELNLYDMDFSVLISKIDHKTEEDVAQVLLKAGETAKEVSGKEVFVGGTSVKDSNIDDFINILKGLDPEAMLKNKFKERMLSLISRAIREIDVRVQYKTVDSSEIDSKILEINKSIKEIEIKLKEEERKIENKFGNFTLYNILNDVEQSLLSEMSLLVRSAKAGEEIFAREINNILRPVLAKSVEANVSIVLQESFDRVYEKIDNLSNSLLLAKVKVSEIGEAVGKVMDILKSEKIKVILSSLAILTDFIAPWLELIVIFLPDLIKLFIDEDKSIEKKIREEVIPKIKYKLEPQVVQALQQIKENFVEEMKAEIEEDQNELIDSLNKAKEEKQNITMNLEQWKIDMNENKKVLTRVCEEL